MSRSLKFVATTLITAVRSSFIGHHPREKADGKRWETITVNSALHSSSRQKADRRHKFGPTPWSQQLQYNQAAWRVCVPLQKK